MHNAVYQRAICNYIVIAEENGAGRRVVLETKNIFKARALEKEINSGIYAGALMQAEVKSEIIGFSNIN